MAKWFKISEFVRSSTAEACGIDNSLPANLQEAADYTLERLDVIREGYGKPIVITSGYRCPQLNKVVGGKPTSQHTKAQAADLKWDSELLQYILRCCKFDQCIEESNRRTRWIHISFKPSGERQQYIRLKV